MSLSQVRGGVVGVDVFNSGRVQEEVIDTGHTLLAIVLNVLSGHKSEVAHPLPGFDESFHIVLGQLCLIHCLSRRGTI